MKAKFLKFHENYRPAYYGTWKKKSKFISARKPLGKDKDRFDYEASILVFFYFSGNVFSKLYNCFTTGIFSIYLKIFDFNII